MHLNFPLDVEIRAASSSGFTRETVERRLADLVAREAAGEGDVTGEIEYLRALHERKWGA
jgi:hypothetical protein